MRWLHARSRRATACSSTSRTTSRKPTMHRTLFVAAVACALAGCASARPEPAPDARYAPAEPLAYTPAVAPGTIYRAGGLHLFMDLRAHDVGDILTVRLIERTNATKESS